MKAPAYRLPHAPAPQPDAPAFFRGAEDAGKARSATGSSAKCLAFKPGVHVNYAETVLRMKDGLPKLKDFPKEFGGSGESVPE